MRPSRKTLRLATTGILATTTVVLAPAALATSAGGDSAANIDAWQVDTASVLLIDKVAAERSAVAVTSLEHCAGLPLPELECQDAARKDEVDTGQEDRSDDQGDVDEEYDDEEEYDDVPPPVEEDNEDPNEDDTENLPPIDTEPGDGGGPTPSGGVNNRNSGRTNIPTDNVFRLPAQPQLVPDAPHSPVLAAELIRRPAPAAQPAPAADGMPAELARTGVGDSTTTIATLAGGAVVAGLGLLALRGFVRRGRAGA